MTKPEFKKNTIFIISISIQNIVKTLF